MLDLSAGSWVLVPLAGALAAAVVTDCRSRRIPNKLTLALAGFGLVAQVMTSGFAGAVDALAGGSLALVALFPFWRLGGFGAGDVKLLAAAGTVLGMNLTLVAIPGTLIAGGVLAVVVLCWRVLRERLPFGAAVAVAGTSPRAALAVLKGRFPYALAIASGVGAALWIGA